MKKHTYETVQEIKEHIRRLDQTIMNSTKKYVAPAASTLISPSIPQQENSVNLGSGAKDIAIDDVRALLQEENQYFIAEREEEIQTAKENMSKVLGQAEIIQREVYEELNSTLAKLDIVLPLPRRLVCMPCIGL
jgi:hypothetical protein